MRIICKNQKNKFSYFHFQFIYYIMNDNIKICKKEWSHGILL